MTYVIPSYIGEEPCMGRCERYPLNLAKSVARRGDYKVEVVCYGEEKTMARRLIEDRVMLRTLPTARRPPTAEPLSWGLIDAVREGDLIHINDIFTRSSEVALLVAKLLGKPVCVTDHGEGRSGLGRSLGMLDLVDSIVCYSRFGQALFPSRSKTELVAGGVDDRFFTPGDGGRERDTFLYVGRLLPSKGVDRLIEALPTGSSLVVCGRPCNSDYEQLLHALASGKLVTFVTHADDSELRELYRRAIAVVVPSVSVDCYGVAHPSSGIMSLALLEGMACGAAVVGTRVGGLPEYVDHGENGYLFDDPTQLTGYLRLLAADPDRARRMGEVGRRRVTSAYGLRSCGMAISSIYGELVGVTSHT